MGILGGNLIADVDNEYIVTRYHYFSDVIDGQEIIMILSAETLPCSTNYSVAPSRCEFSSLPREVSSLVLKFFINGERSPEPDFLNLRIGLLVFRVMGGDPLVTEPAVIKMDDEVKEILEKAGLMDFFRKFAGFNESISRKVAESWNEGNVKVDGLAFTIFEGLIAEVSRLPLEGKVISREKTNQIEQLTKFIKEDETFCWLQSSIARESLPVPWDRVVVQIMKYLTLEGKFRKLFGYHIAILNSVRNSTKINLPVFHFKSLEKSVKSVKAGKGKLPLHQGLLNLLVNFEKAKNPSPSVTLRGLVRSSGTLVSRAQLLLGPSAAAPKSSAKPSVSKEEEDSPSEDCGTSSCKKGSNRKRKSVPQTLAANLAKCSRRSARLKEKSTEKVKIVDYISSEEEKSEGEDTNMGDQCGKEKVSIPLEDNKDSTKIPTNNQAILKELRSHLKILNGLGGSLTGTCACINLLSLEIANYLKEVVSHLKELNSGRP
eukprot:Gb_17438 [translate_table: standard]